MFHLEREQLAHEYLSLKQKTELVNEIIKMLTERAIFYPKYSSSKQVHMSWYLSILMTDIRELVSIN